MLAEQLHNFENTAIITFSKRDYKMLSKYIFGEMSFSFIVIGSWICQFVKLDKIHKFYPEITEPQF